MKTSKATKKIIIINIFIFVLFFMFQTSYATGTFESTKYVVADKYVKGITAETSISELKKNITGCTKIEVLDKDNNLITDETILVGSKMKLAIDRKTIYEIVTGGDINGDGKVTSTDILLLKKGIIGTQELDVQIGDIDCSSKITSTDLLLLKKVIVGNIDANKIYETKGTNAEWEYTVNKITKQASIEKYIGIKTTINIPETIGEANVQGIGANFAQNGSTAKIINIPKTVTSMSNESFINCSNLSEINIAEGNTNYSSTNGVLFNKTKTQIITYPQNKKGETFAVLETVATVKENCFYKTKNLQKLYLGKNITNIEKDGIKDITGTAVVATNSKALEYVKANNVKYVINNPTQINVTNVTNINSTNQGKISFTATDTDGIVAWSITNGIVAPASWNTITQSVSITKEQAITQEGTYYIYVKDALGEITRNEVKIVKLAEVSSIKITSPTSGTYKAGQIVEIQATFTKPVTGTAPTLKIKVGQTSKKATFSKIVNNVVYYTYTADSTNGTITIESFTGGNLKDSNGTLAAITAKPNSGYNIRIVNISFTIPQDVETLWSVSVYLMDADTGEVLYSRNPQMTRRIASTTKLMTCILALEAWANDDLNEQITVPGAVISVGTQMGIHSQDTLSKIDLLHGIMLPSGNDAADAIARILAPAHEYSDSVAKFAGIMTNRAKELGMKNTNYVNASGLDRSAEGKPYSTAEDLAILARYAMKNKTLMSIVSKTEYTAKVTYKGATRTINLVNTNRALPGASHAYEYTTGMKTGTTQAAGNCLIATANKNGNNLICVLLGYSTESDTRRKFTDAGKYFEAGFNYLEKTK